MKKVTFIAFLSVIVLGAFGLDASGTSIPAPSVSASCESGKAILTVTWSRAGRSGTYWVHIDDDSNWSNGYWREASSNEHSIAPAEYTATAGESGALTLVSGRTYYVRIHYTNTGENSPTKSIVIPSCGSDTNCDPESLLVGQVNSSGQATVTNKGGCSFKVGLASYKKFSNDLEDQELFDSELRTIGPKTTISLDVNVPPCAAQIDLFYGDLILSFKGGVRYGERLLAVVHTNGTNYCQNIPNLTGSCTISHSTAEIGETVTYTANASGGTGAFSYGWTGTDGLSGSSRIVNKSYGTAGTKSGTVTITSGSQSITRTCHVVIEEEPMGCVDIIKETFDVDGDTLRPVAQFTFKLDNDRTVRNDSNGRARFLNVSPGQHQVTEIIPDGWDNFNVTPANGQVTVPSGSLCATVVFKNRQESPPTPDFTASCTVNRSTASIDESVTYTANGSGGTGNYTYSWNGTDNLGGSSRSVSKSYGSAGTKSATVTVTSGNNSLTRTCNVVIEDDQPEIIIPNVYAYCDYNTSKISVSWNEAERGDSGYFVELDNDSNWSNGYWRKFVSSGTLQTTAPDGFYSVGGASGNPVLTNRSYWVRINYIETGEYSPIRHVTGASCATPSVVNVYENPGPGPASVVYLNEVPYTGIGSTAKITLFMSVLGLWSGYIAYAIVRKRRQKMFAFAVAEESNGEAKIHPYSRGEISGDELRTEAQKHKVLLSSQATEMIAQASSGSAKKASFILRSLLEKLGGERANAQGWFPIGADKIEKYIS
ncbi:MAG: PKD domain-containing protein [bacterium]|nr:PKD domain-containing protein [bacterium]